MSEPAKIEDRVTKLETEMVEVRYLATKTDKEASDNTAARKGQVGMLNILRADQIDQGKRLDRVERKVDHLERKVDNGFAQANANFATIEENFARLKAGQDRITELLTDEPDEPGPPS